MSPLNSKIKNILFLAFKKNTSKTKFFYNMSPLNSGILFFNIIKKNK